MTPLSDGTNITLGDAQNRMLKLLSKKVQPDPTSEVRVIHPLVTTRYLWVWYNGKPYNVDLLSDDIQIFKDARRYHISLCKTISELIAMVDIDLRESVQNDILAP